MSTKTALIVGVIALVAVIGVIEIGAWVGRSQSNQAGQGHGYSGPHLTSLTETNLLRLPEWGLAVALSDDAVRYVVYPAKLDTQGKIIQYGLSVENFHEFDGCPEYDANAAIVPPVGYITQGGRSSATTVEVTIDGVVYSYEPRGTDNDTGWVCATGESDRATIQKAAREMTSLFEGLHKQN